MARGAGTGLSGGAISQAGGIVVAFSRMNRILEVDAENQRAVVQPGVVNLQLSEHVSHLGLYFAPDPSSQKACTIGGNVAENSGGPHTLMHGVTVNHVTGVEVVMPNGDIVQFGGKAAESGGYDLTGFFVGSEGTVGIATAITVKLLRKPELVATLLGIFESIDDAAHTVSAITADGITPAALEMLDGWTLRTVEAFCHAGYPLDAGAVLLIELGRFARGGRRAGGCGRRSLPPAEGARSPPRQERRRARAVVEGPQDWLSRRSAASLLRITRRMALCRAARSPPCCSISATWRRNTTCVIGNIFHAGDGNLHPLILFDMRDAEQFEHVMAASREILQLLHRCRRLHHRRAWRRHGKARPDAAAVYRRRSRRHDEPAERFQRPRDI